MRIAQRITHLAVAAAAAAVALACLATPASAAVMAVTDRAAYHAATVRSGQDVFAGLSAGDLLPGPLSRNAGELGYQVAAAGDAGLQDLYVLDNGDGGAWLSTNYATSHLTFSGFDASVRAIGGSFFTTDFFGAAIPFGLTLRVQDASGMFDYTLPSTTPAGFLGFISDSAIQSLQVFSGQGGVDRFVTAADVTLGVVPEPGSVLLVGLGVLALAGTRRARRID